MRGKTYYGSIDGFGKQSRLARLDLVGPGLLKPQKHIFLIKFLYFILTFFDVSRIFGGAQSVIY